MGICIYGDRSNFLLRLGLGSGIGLGLEVRVKARASNKA